MANIKPSDDAILIAASNLTSALARLRYDELANYNPPNPPDEDFDYFRQERLVASMLGRMIEQVQKQVETK